MLAPLTHPTASLRRYVGDYAAHQHGHAQILVGQQGRLELEVEGRAAYVDTACGLVIPPGAAHASMATHPAQVLVVDAPADAAWHQPRRFVLPQGAALWHVLGDGQRVQNVLQAALQAPRWNTNRRDLDLRHLEQALDQALHAPWSTARMAALYCLSPQRFHARWLALTGLTPQLFLRQRRLAQAGRLLRAGQGLEAVALQVGYGSATALAFALRRDTGQGARRLRRATGSGSGSGG